MTPEEARDLVRDARRGLGGTEGTTLGSGFETSPYERMRARRNLPPTPAAEALQDPMMTETKEANVVWRLLDFLNRSQYATVGVVKEVIESAKEDRRLSASEVWEAAKGGLTGEQKHSWIDIAQDAIPGEHPWIEKPLGFAGDIVLDPINLIPLGWVAKAGKLTGIPKLAKFGVRLSKMDKALSWIGDTAAGKKIGQALVPGYELRKIPGAYRSWRQLQLDLQNIRRSVRVEFEREWDAFRKTARALGEDPDEAAAMMIRLHEAGKGTDIPKAYGDFYEKIKTGFERMAIREREYGLLKQENVKKFYFPHIFEWGKVVQEGDRLIVKQHAGFFTKFGIRSRPFFTKPRRFESIEQVKEFLFKMRNDKNVNKVAPIDNWFRGYAIRRFVSESAIQWRKYVDGALTEFGTPAGKWMAQALKQQGLKLDEVLAALRSGKGPLFEKMMAIPQNHVFVTSMLNLKSPATKDMATKLIMQTLQRGQDPNTVGNLLEMIFKKTGDPMQVFANIEDAAKIGFEGVYLFPKEFSDVIRRTFRPFATDEGTKGLLGAFDTGMYWWKSMATSLRLPFHARNAVSNLWLMYLGGIKGQMLGKRIIDSLLVQTRGKGFLGHSADDLVAAADRFGVRAFGWMGADFPRMLQRELHIAQKRSAVARKLGGGANPYNLIETVSRLGRRVGTNVEDNARLALFLEQLKKGGLSADTLKEFGAKSLKDVLDRPDEFPELFRKLQDASLHVKKFMFDYTELTDAERNIFKRVMPFYTWMRKNIPLQIESLFKQPHKYARLGDLERDLFPDAPIPKDLEKAIPPWMKKMGYKMMPEKWPYFIPTNWIEKETGDRIMWRLDLPTEDLGRLTRLQEYLGGLSPAFTLAMTALNTTHFPAPRKLAEPFQRQSAPFWASFLPKQIQQMMDVGPSWDRATGQLTLGMNPQWHQAMRTAFPFLADWEKVFPRKGQLVKAQMEKGEMRFDKWSALTYLTGIQFRRLEKDKELRSYMLRQQEAQKAVRKGMWQRAWDQKSATERMKEAVKIYNRIVNQQEGEGLIGGVLPF